MKLSRRTEKLEGVWELQTVTEMQLLLISAPRQEPALVLIGSTERFALPTGRDSKRLSARENASGPDWLTGGALWPG